MFNSVNGNVTDAWRLTSGRALGGIEWINKRLQHSPQQVQYEFLLVSMEVFGLAIFHTQQPDIAVRNGIVTREHVFNNAKMWDDLMDYNAKSTDSAAYALGRKTQKGQEAIQLLNQQRIRLFEKYASNIDDDHLLKGVAMAINRLGSDRAWKSKIGPAVLSKNFHDRLGQAYTLEADLVVEVLIGQYEAYIHELAKSKWIL
jgi:hypothetical protein